MATAIRTLVLTLFWAALQGSFTPFNLAVGAVLGLGIVLFTRPLFPDEGAGTGQTPRPLRRLWRVTVLLAVFVYELVASSVRVAAYTLQPRLRMRSGIVAYPLDVTTDREITVLANLITLTPGTLTLGVSADQRTLYVHSMSVETDSGDEVVEDIKGSLEKHVHRAIGPRDE
jgi:multicomponent Na+:H+ antiporter subunit E